MREGDKVEGESVYPVKHHWYHMASNELVKPRKMSAGRKSAFLELEVYQRYEEVSCSDQIAHLILIALETENCELSST